MISVVITCYREGELLLDAVESIQKQTLPALEIIIVNDASSDKTTNQICRKLEKLPNIKVIWQSTNGGPSVARNVGFSQAQGDILVPLDGDDQLPQGALAAIDAGFKTMPEADFVYGAYVRQDRPDQPGQLISATGDIQLSQQLAAKPWSLSTNWQLLGTTPLRKSAWATVGGYDVDFGVKDLHDVEFWIRVLATGCCYVTIHEPIYIWRKYLGSNSGQVTPYAWYRIAKKYFDVYEAVGLKCRAYELLLLGSKWLGHFQEIQQYSQAIWNLLGKGQTQFSTIVSLAIPSSLLRWLATQAQQNR